MPKCSRPSSDLLELRKPQPAPESALTLMGGKGGGGGGMTEEPNTLRANTKARILDLISEGQIGGLIDGAKSIFLDDTQLQNDDGSWNFTGVTFLERFGLPDQVPIPGFEFGAAEIPVGIEMKSGQTVTRTVNGADVDSIVAKVGVSSLQYVDQKNSKVTGTSVSFLIQLVDPTSLVVYSQVYSITGKTSSEYQRGYYIKLPSDDVFLLKVTRITPDAATQDLSNGTVFAGYTEINEDKFAYPDSALIGIEIDAQQFGSGTPKRGYLVRGIMVKVPVNYDPVAHTYSGPWNGTFKLASTNDPAWIFYDLLTNDRYGLGEVIPEDTVDKWALYEISQYCNEAVPDGYGGTEPRFTFDAWIYNQADAHEALTLISSAFRGMVYWKTGTVTAVQDAPEDPIIDVNDTQIIGGTFTYEKTAKSARATVVYVTWSDPADMYRPAVEVVEDFEGVARLGWIRRDITLIGCQSRSLAIRMARWMLYTEQTENESVTYQCYADHLRVAPGRVVKVVDSKRLGWRAGGRLSQVISPTQVKLDAPYEFQAGAVYKITVIKADGSPEEIPFTNPGVTTDTITLAFAPAQAQQTGWPWSILSNDPDQWTAVASGLLVSQAGGVCTMPVSVKFLPGQTYRVIVDGISGKESIAVVNPEITTNQFTLAGFATGTLTSGSPFTLVVNDAAKSLYRVLLVREIPDEVGIITYEVNGVLHNPNKFAAIEQGIQFTDVPRYRPRPINKVSPLYNLTIKEVLETSATSYLRHLDLSWSPPILPKDNPGDPDVLDPYVSSYVVFMKRDDDSFELIGNPGDPQFRIQNAVAGTYVVHVCSVNSFGFRSAPFEAAITVNPVIYIPPAVTGLELVNGAELGDANEFIGRDAKIQWRKASTAVNYELDDELNGADSGGLDPMFKDYRVCVFTTAGIKLREEFVTDQNYVYTYEKNYEDTSGSPTRSFVFIVQARDKTNGLGVATLLRVQNTPPTTPVMSWDPTLGGATFSYDTPSDPDFAGMVVWAGTSAGFTPSDANKIHDGLGAPILAGVLAGAVYYIKYGAYDAFDRTISQQTLTITTGNVVAGDFDVTPPAVPTGLALSSTLTTNPDGTQVIKLTSTWTGVADSDLAGYEIDIQEAAGSFIEYGTSGVTFEWLVKANVSYTAKVRSVDKLGNRSAFTSTVSHTTTKDTVAPAAPTSVVSLAAIQTGWLTWMNDSAIDLSGVEIWENTTNNSGTATLVATVNALPSMAGGYSRSGLATGTTKYYWLKSVDTSGNRSGFSSGVSMTAAAVTNADVVVGSLTGDRITAGTFTGDRFNTSTSLPGTITVGVTGVSIGTVESRASDPAARVNAMTTKITPGLIQISGATTLADWRNGTDTTKIEGGAIYANTVNANSLKIGSRGVSTVSLDFSVNAALTTLSWTAGYVFYTNDAGALTTINVAAGSTTWLGGFLYVYWVKDATTLSVTTNDAVARGVNNIIFCTWYGSGNFAANGGAGTVINGDRIVTGSVNANRLVAQTIVGSLIASQTLTARLFVVGGNEEAYPDGDKQDTGWWTGGGGTANGCSVVSLGAGWTVAGDRGIQVFNGTTDVYSNFFKVEPGATYRIRARIWTNAGGWNGAFWPLIHMPAVQWFSLAHGTGVDPSTANAANAIVAGADTLNLEWVYTNPTSCTQWQFRMKGSITAGAPVFMQVSIVRMNDTTMIKDGAITTNKITVNSLNGDRIQVGTLNADRIIAGSITTTMLSVQSDAINKDPYFYDTNYWQCVGPAGTNPPTNLNTGWFIENANSTVTAVTQAPQYMVLHPPYLSTSLTARYHLYTGAVGSPSKANFESVQPSTIYTLSVGCYNGSNQWLGYQVDWYNASGTYLTSSGSTVAAGATGVFSFQVTSPTTAYYARLVCYNESGTTLSSTIYVGGFFLRKALQGSLYVDGTITANKLSVTSLSAITANLGTITAGSLNINNRFMVASDGTMTLQSSGSGARLVITNSLIQVYDASNVERVRLGIW